VTDLRTSAGTGTAAGARLKFASALTVAALILHALYLVGDRTWWGEWFSIWPPVGWLVLALPAVTRRKNWLALLLLAALVGLYGEWPRLGRSVDPPSGAVRVVTWNVAGDPAAWRHLEPLRPDLVAVQESAGPPRPIWEGYEWHGTSDPAVLTRFPALPLPTRSVGPWTEPQLLLVSPPGRARLLVVNVRLSLPSIVTWVAGGFRDSNPAEGHLRRVRQYARLAELVEEARAAARVESVMLLGDFNAPARMPSLAPIRRRLQDCWGRAGLGWGGTATADLPLARIDHCWLSPGIDVASARTLRMPVSDHRLLIVDLLLPETGSSAHSTDEPSKEPDARP
jgi:endonuclease/exonuclease/phosphatase (EEP) superfamily protein YafD